MQALWHWLQLKISRFLTTRVPHSDLKRWFLQQLCKSQFILFSLTFYQHFQHLVLILLIFLLVNLFLYKQRNLLLNLQLMCWEVHTWGTPVYQLQMAFFPTVTHPQQDQERLHTMPFPLMNRSQILCWNAGGIYTTDKSMPDLLSMNFFLLDCSSVSNLCSLSVYKYVYSWLTFH